MSLLIVCDLETSGLNPTNGCVWDLAAIAVRDGEIIGEFESLVRPNSNRFQKEQRDVVKRISGLDDAGLLGLFDAPTGAQVTQRFLDWLSEFEKSEDPPATITLTSFNVAFDAAFLGSDPWNLTQKIEERFACRAGWGPCVMEACSEKMGEAGLLQRTFDGKRYLWPKLVAACKHFEVEFVETHRAKADALAAAKLAILLGAAP